MLTTATPWTYSGLLSLLCLMNYDAVFTVIPRSGSMFLSHEGQNLKTFVGLILWLIMFVWTFVGMEKLFLAPTSTLVFELRAAIGVPLPRLSPKSLKIWKNIFFFQSFLFCVAGVSRTLLVLLNNWQVIKCQFIAFIRCR